MEILSQFVWIAVALTVVVVTGLARKRHIRKRKAAQFRADESTIINIYNDFRSDDIRIYKDLPNRASRIDWMKRHYPEFMEAAERHFKENPRIDVEGVLAVHLDVRLIRGIYTYKSHDEVFRTYQSATFRKSLNEYQVEVDKSNVELAKLEEARAKAAAKYRAEQQAHLAKEAAAEKVRKNVAKTYWKSLSKEEKEAFKKAQGSSARKKTLPSTASTGYSSETLYPLIMATQFSGINSDTGRSIDYCESPSYAPSSNGDSGSHSDGGSSFVSFDGGGGDCGGGGGD